MGLNSPELRFEFTFSGGAELGELFSAADDLDKLKKSLYNLECKYTGILFHDKCDKILEVSAEDERIKKEIEELKARQKANKSLLSILNKEMEEAGASGVKSILTKIAKKKSEISKLDTKGVSKEDYPILWGLLNQ